MAKSLHIGPLRFEFCGKFGADVTYANPVYRAFLQPPDGKDRSSLITLNLTLEEGCIPCPTSPPLYEAGRHWAIWQEADGWLICSGYANRTGPSASCRLARTLERATLFVDGDPADSPLRYPLDQVLCWALLGKCGGLLLHAAGVERNGAGVMLTGRSGAGKSTLSDLCLTEGWDVLNDDRVIAYPVAGHWMMAGTPWHGSGRFACNRVVPLQRVLMVQQDSMNRIESLSSQEARHALLAVTGIPWFEDTWTQRGLDALARMIAEVDVRRFCFTRTKEAGTMMSESQGNLKERLG